MYGQFAVVAGRPPREAHLQRTWGGSNRSTADAPRIFSDFEEPTQGQFLSHGIYAAGGMTADTLIEHFRVWAADKLTPGAAGGRSLIPDVIFVRGQYVCLHDRGMSDAFVVLDLATIKDGGGLLSFVSLLYRSMRLPPHNGPWWLQHWDFWNLRFGIEQGASGGRIVGWQTPKGPVPSAAVASAAPVAPANAAAP